MKQNEYLLTDGEAYVISLIAEDEKEVEQIGGDEVVWICVEDKEGNHRMLDMVVVPKGFTGKFYEIKEKLEVEANKDFYGD